MTGEDQGVDCGYGYIILEENGKNVIHYYYVEQHAFQTPGMRNIKYKNIFLDCEVDENNNIIGNIDLKPGADGFPLQIDQSLVEEYNINSNTTIIMVNKSLDDTKRKAQETLKQLEEG